VAEDDNGRRIGAMIARVEQAARRRMQAEQIEIPIVDRLAAQPLRPIAGDGDHANPRRADDAVECRQRLHASCPVSGGIPRAKIGGSWQRRVTRLIAMSEREYLLGTHDEEIERLGLQHRVWRSDVLETWRRAGLAAGQTVLDLGCGPGHATLDLAEIAGPKGRVIAIDQSRRFLDHLAMRTRERGWTHVESYERDLDAGELPAVRVDFAWCRWIFAFVREPEALLARVAGTLNPGGTIVLHEYFDYRTWRLLPRVPDVEAFVAAVMASWRADGGEPDIGMDLPAWLEALGLEIVEVRPLIRIAGPGEAMWTWPAAYLRVGSGRLARLGILTRKQAEKAVIALDAAEARRGSRMVTPGVLSVTARRPLNT
jgi:SAM-dependent methyltransferase